MNETQQRWLLRLGILIAVLAVVAAYWLLPIRGQVTLSPGDTSWLEPWPRVRLSPPAPLPGQQVTLRITDNVAWPHILLTLDGAPVPLQDWREGPQGQFTWTWTFAAPSAGAPAEIAFYHDCDTGCQQHARLRLPNRPHDRTATVSGAVATKQCVVYANPARDWHGRSGWDVELTYAGLADSEFWGIDDLARRVHQAAASGLRVLVRVDYDQGQSMPPAGDQLALAAYLQYLRRLARDDRLSGVYGFVLGSGFNELASNSQDKEHPVTPEWYARVFNGYGEKADHTDNAVQAIRSENSGVRVLVGPVRPWNTDQTGRERYASDVPWLNYMNTLVAALDESARAKLASGVALAAPDGFALHAPGRVGELGAAEPQTDQRSTAWDGAQAGFRVYQDWLDVINSYATTRALPVYITSTNTFVAAEGVPPAQNYPPGWLTAALAEVEQQPQVQALCWFVDEDRSGDKRWDNFSLTQRPGRLLEAGEEFDALLLGQN